MMKLAEVVFNSEVTFSTQIFYLPNIMSSQSHCNLIEVHGHFISKETGINIYQYHVGNPGRKESIISSLRDKARQIV